VPTHHPTASTLAPAEPPPSARGLALWASTSPLMAATASVLRCLRTRGGLLHRHRRLLQTLLRLGVRALGSATLGFGQTVWVDASRARI
jgi:hypothetical protein